MNVCTALCIIGDCVLDYQMVVFCIAAQYLSFCSQVEIDEENREECGTCFIRGQYEDLHKKYEDVLAKNAELVKLTSELCAENEASVARCADLSAHMRILRFVRNCADFQ